MHKHVTQKDIARELGLSVPTVSRVISGTAKTYGTDPEIIRRVNEAVKRSGYSPNLAGRALSTRKYQTIGLLFYSTNEPFYSELIPELQTRIFKRGYAAICGFWNDFIEADAAITSVINHGVDGVITCHKPESIPEYVHAVFFRETPRNRDYVDIDMDKALLEAVRYLQVKGHSKICFVCNKGEWGTSLVKNLRIPGVKLLCATLDITGFVMRNTELKMAEALRPLLELPTKERPTAFVCSHGVVGMSLLSTVASSGFSVPRDLSVIAIENTKLPLMCTPPLTTFAHPTEKIADALVDTLFARLARERIPPIHRIVEAILSERASVAAPSHF